MVLDAHVPLVKPSELESAEINVPDATGADQALLAGWRKAVERTKSRDSRRLGAVRPSRVRVCVTAGKSVPGDGVYGADRAICEGAFAPGAQD